MTIEVRTAIDILRFANEKGEIGYAYGGDDVHLPFVNECYRRGWIEFVGNFSTETQRRDRWRITDRGRRALVT